jgi:hypothetical protein
MLDRPAIVDIHAAHLDSAVVMEDDGGSPAIGLAVKHRLVPLVPFQRVGSILGERDLSRLMIARTRTIDSVLSILPPVGDPIASIARLVCGDGIT